MARFSISMSVEVEAENYHEAFQIQKSIFEFVQGHDAVTSGPYEIDVEQQDGEEE